MNTTLENYRNAANAKWDMILNIRKQLKRMEKRVQYYKHVRNVLNRQGVSTQITDSSIVSAKSTITTFLDRIVEMKKLRKVDFEMIKHLENAKFIEDSKIV